MRDGILILDKPQNWTSHDCVAVARKALGTDRIGHGGTLDPMACGLLPLFIGSATRIMEYLDMDDKTYRCRVRLGITTDTQDIWGETVRERPADGITQEQFREALLSFKGDHKQLPPMYSAVRIDGKRLYEYARDGQAVEVKPRDITVKDVTFFAYDEETREGEFEITVSKGTYIRTICNDLGEKLGCGAAMSYLKRTAAGVFTLEDSTTPERLKDLMNMSKELGDGYEVPEDIIRAVMPADVPLVRLGKLTMSRDRAWYFVAGSSIRWRQVRVTQKPTGSAEVKNRRGRPYDVLYRVYMDDGRFLGTGYFDRKSGELKADKIFVKRQEL